ncbi:hypothetical protein [Bosea sp. (in: a-proteobacteria)]|uniref:hypothetical protein n=1 Tax=Bosea sp. (in: a-proteobacteria) TaxID=1871050 RepID=UPI0026084312|nr:hypothetical protein [Bosea sp. (in: a-proteobacteria)]MCO5092091.1 hypothetical protein [Bosea sp. (in: a-proteobacteria)]
MDRIILTGVDQGVMIGGRFDGWLAHLTQAGWVTIRKLDEADPYASLPDALRQSRGAELGAVGPATGVSLGQSAHDAEKRRRNFLSQFPAVNAQELHENMLAATASLSPAATPVSEAGGEAITARYTNWRGETAERTFIPHRVFFGSNEWHPEPQVLIEATDCEKGALRTFAAAGFALAKPASSPAGGDVVERVATIIDPEIWAIEQPIPTRGHVEDFHQRRRSSCDLAQRIIAALSQSTSAGRVGE